MNVTVDGIIYQNQSHGGISHLYDEILPRMCQEDDSLYINLITSGKCKKVPPVHPHIDHHILFPIDRLLRPTRVWGATRFHIRSYFQYLAHKNSIDELWHSTFFTMPFFWKGPIVLTVYDMIHERFAVDIFNKPYHKDNRKYKQQCAARADLLICISEATKKDLVQYFHVDPGKIRVIHLASSPVFRYFKNNQCLSAPITAKPFILYVGGRQSYKNFGSLLKAYSSWHGRKDVDLVIIGAAWTEQEKEILRNLKLDDKVHHLVEIDDEGLCNLYNRASAYVLPSLYEGFGIPLLEAMACGCPIVASRIPSTLEVAKDCPVYFEPREIDSFVSAFDNILTEGRDSKRVELGLKRANEFSWDKTAHETLNVYRELISAS